MKKNLFFCFLLICIGTLFHHCSKAPVFPNTPQIEYSHMVGYPVGDSIMVTINFKDGDGDLGLEPNALSPPFHEFDFEKNGEDYIEKNPNDPYKCKYHVIGQYDLDIDNDTVLVKPNLYYNNYILDIFVRQPDNSFLKMDMDNFCPDFNQRFPVLNAQKNGPIEGSLSYSVKGLFGGLPGQTLKFQIYIFDRALNKSNIVETPEFTLPVP